MLADAAVKYLSTSISQVPALLAEDAEQLAALRPLLRSLATSAAAALSQCLALHSGDDGSSSGGGMLTYSSTLRALCLLLRGVLVLQHEAQEPHLLVPFVEGVAAAAPGPAASAALACNAAAVAAISGASAPPLSQQAAEALAQDARALLTVRACSVLSVVGCILAVGALQSRLFHPGLPARPPAHPCHLSCRSRR